jgi:hypothetical protein
VTLRFSGHINALLSKLLPKRQRKPGFKPQLSKYLRFWRRYGFYGVMALTAALTGIPLGVWISSRLGTGKTPVMVTLFVLCVFWVSLSYFAAL